AAMEIAESVFVLPDLLTPEECREYIEVTEARGYEAAPITTAVGFKMRPDIRNNTRGMIDDLRSAEAPWQPKRDRSAGFFRGRQAIGLSERFRFYGYAPGERFAPHRDGPYRRDIGEVSLLTFLVYLNEGFAGGETVVEGRPITPRRGLSLVFEHQLLHEGVA